MITGPLEPSTSPAPPAPTFAAPSWPPAARAPRSKANTGLVIGVVVGIVGLGAGAVGLITAGNTASAERPPAALADVQPALQVPDAPAGGQPPTAITLPGAQPAAPITTATTPTSDPATSEPATNDTATNDTLIDGAAIDIGGTDTVDSADAAGGDDAARIELDHGFSLQPVPSWRVVDHDGSGAILQSADARTVMYFNLLDGYSDAASAAAKYRDVLEDAVAELAVGDVVDGTIVDSALVSSASFGYTGFTGTDQTGRHSINGRVFIDVRADGLVLVSDIVLVDPDDGVDSTADINAILASIHYDE